MGNKPSDHEISARILVCMERAPAGNYTPVQLARNTGLWVAEVQRGIAQLHRTGIISQAPGLAFPAFRLAGEQPSSVGRMTPRETADRQRARRSE